MKAGEEQNKPISDIGWDGHKRTAGNAVAEQMRSDNQQAKERMDMLNRGIMPDDLKDSSLGFIITCISKNHYKIVLKLRKYFNSELAKNLQICYAQAKTGRFKLE